MLCPGYLYYISFNSQVNPVAGYFTDEKTKAPAKSV